MASHALAMPLNEPANLPDSALPSVLVVDSDPGIVGNCGDMLEELGYSHQGTTSARQALDLLTRNPTIQIVLADVDLPTMNGIALIEEGRARIGDSRPIAAILATHENSTDLAMRALHLEAVDVLVKPLAFDAYSAAMRRAFRFVATRRPVTDSTSVSDFSQQLARLVSVLETKSRDPLPPEGKAGKAEVAITLRTMITSRSQRSRYFPTEIFADPAWDILLDLARAQIEGQQVSVSSVCIAASVPMSTALRWVRQMTEAGLLTRWTDPKDRRRDLIALTEKTTANMMEYLATVHAMMKKA